MTGHNTAWTIAAPSFIWPDTVTANCFQLQHMVQEVAVVLFSSKDSLAYTQEDLSPELAYLPLSYHIHLPLDLPWSRGEEAVLSVVKGLLEKTNFLNPWAFVLHPPASSEQMKNFYHLWIQSGFSGQKLLLENIKDNDLFPMWSWIRSTDCRICLDMGHVVSYYQERILNLDRLFERIAMVHVYGGLGGDRHGSLARICPKGLDLLPKIFSRLDKSAVVVLEVFDPEDLKESLDIFSSWVNKSFLSDKS